MRFFSRSKPAISAPIAARSEPIEPRLLQHLDLVEAEIKAIGYWVIEKPSEAQQKTFAHWLQFQFLPTARKPITKNDVPENSMVGVMAMRQYDYHSHVPEAQRLFSLLSEFDSLVMGRAK